MTEFKAYRILAGIKNASPFTKDLTVTQYLEDIKHRIKVWYGIDASNWTAVQVLQLISEENIKPLEH